jgi:phospholipase D1/2
MSQKEDDLAYGRYYESQRGSGGDSSRGLSDTFKKLKDSYKTHQSSGQNHGQPGNQPVSDHPPRQR